MLRLVAAFGVLALGSVLLWANWPHEALGRSATADLVVVSKADRTLELLNDGSIIRTYPISLGGDPAGPKRREGDEKTPEGTYTIDYRKADSSFYRALHISYPSATEQKWAQKNGVDPGGLIMIHGAPNGLAFIGRLHRMFDWTDGCIAVTNAEIDEIWSIVPDGTPIRIEP